MQQKHTFEIGEPEATIFVGASSINVHVASYPCHALSPLYDTKITRKCQE